MKLAAQTGVSTISMSDNLNVNYNNDRSWTGERSYKEMVMTRCALKAALLFAVAVGTVAISIQASALNCVYGYEIPATVVIDSSAPTRTSAASSYPSYWNYCQVTYGRSDLWNADLSGTADNFPLTAAGPGTATGVGVYDGSTHNYCQYTVGPDKNVLTMDNAYHYGQPLSAAAKNKNGYAADSSCAYGAGAAGTHSTYWQCSMAAPGGHAAIACAQDTRVSYESVPGGWRSW